MGYVEQRTNQKLKSEIRSLRIVKCTVSMHEFLFVVFSLCFRGGEVQQVGKFAQDLPGLALSTFSELGNGRPNKFTIHKVSE